jgi:hypothetical protein
MAPDMTHQFVKPHSPIRRFLFRRVKELELRNVRSPARSISFCRKAEGPAEQVIWLSLLIYEENLSASWNTNQVCGGERALHDCGRLGRDTTHRRQLCVRFVHSTYLSQGPLNRFFLSGTAVISV